MSKLRGRPFDCVESSIFMERHFRKYKVHSRFYKNINAEMVYMGFPEKCMEPLKREVELSGYSWIQVDENCVDIQGLPIAKSMISVCMCVDVPVIFSKLPFWP